MNIKCVEESTYSIGVVMTTTELLSELCECGEILARGLHYTLFLDPIPSGAGNHLSAHVVSEVAVVWGMFRLCFVAVCRCAGIQDWGKLRLAQMKGQHRNCITVLCSQLRMLIFSVTWDVVPQHPCQPPDCLLCLFRHKALHHSPLPWETPGPAP